MDELVDWWNYWLIGWPRSFVRLAHSHLLRSCIQLQHAFDLGANLVAPRSAPAGIGRFDVGPRPFPPWVWSSTAQAVLHDQYEVAWIKPVHDQYAVARLKEFPRSVRNSSQRRQFPCMCWTRGAFHLNHYNKVQKHSRKYIHAACDLRIQRNDFICRALSWSMNAPSIILPHDQCTQSSGVPPSTKDRATGAVPWL